MKSLYLIGGSGFVGKNLARYLYNDYQITIFDKFIDIDFFSTFPSIETCYLDLSEKQIPESYPTPDYLINLASIVTAERDLSLFDKLISSNIKILLNLFNRFKEDKALNLFIQFGSSEEYGNKQPPFTEDMREQPNSPYALVKQLTTNTAMMLYTNYKFPIMVVRPGNLFGPMQNAKKIIAYTINMLKKNQPLNVSLCEQKRDFIYIEDFAYIIKMLLLNHTHCIGQIVNASSGKSYSLKSIIEFCKKELKSTSKVNYGIVPYRENEIMDMICSIDKLEEIINKKIDFDIYKGLETINLLNK